MKDIASFSGGRLSAVMVDRLLAAGHNTDIIFMDTGIEDDDNYRFIQDCRERWDRKYVSHIIRLSEGRTPYEVSHAQHVIPNSRVAPCTRRLKIEPFTAYLKEHYDPADITINIGYDFSEIHRCEATTKNYARFGWKVDYPMLWTPIEFRDYDAIIRSWGIEPPRMYAMGYSHANCGGLCVKQGAGDWIKTLINFPERFEMAETWERKMRKNDVNAKYTILTRVKNGKEENISLETLRTEYQSGQTNNMFSDFNCIRCGIGDLVDGEA